MISPAFSTGGSVKRRTGAARWAAGQSKATAVAAAAAASAATPHARRTDRVAATRASASALAVGPAPATLDPDGTPVSSIPAPSAMPRSWSLTSCAVWMRSSGSFARQFRISRSMPCGGTTRDVEAGGAPEGGSPTGGGSRSRIAAMSDAWLLPSNARRPANSS
jgi:hypothetical protein